MSHPIRLVCELAAEDVRRSVDFYVTYFGFKELENTTDESGVPTWAELAHGDIRLMFQKRRDLAKEFGVMAEELAGRSCLVLRYGTQDVELLYSAITASGEGVIARPLESTAYGTTEFAVFDPDGNIVIIAAGKA